MNRLVEGFCSASALALLAAAPVLAQPASTQSDSAREAPPSDTNAIMADIIVTAQKRAQALSDVGMSITAQTGEDLMRLGINDTASLAKVTPGMNFTPSLYGIPVFTIRGVGFQDTSLAASPTVSVYTDEVPLPFSAMTMGASLDVQRVEILKGPQGLLFGQNATGGAINYVANRPTDDLQAGFDVSYGRFNQFDFQGFISGPLTDTLKARLAVRRQSMSDWQQGFTRPDTTGQQNIWIGRLLIDWEPTDDFTAIFNINGWVDKSDTQAPQLFGVLNHNPPNEVDPRILAYPMAPHNNRAADRSRCINANPINHPFSEMEPPYGFPRPEHATDCTDLARNNKFFSVSLRMDWNLSDFATLTSVSAYEHFKRQQPTDADGVIYQNFETQQTGSVDTIFQELRLSGDLPNDGNWIIGANFERDKTFDQFMHALGGSTATPVLGLPVNGATPWNRQRTKTYAAFANIEYGVTDDLSVHAGIRYTKMEKSYIGCANDTGSGEWAEVSRVMQNLLAMLYGIITPEEYDLGAGPGINPGAGNCATVSVAPVWVPAVPHYERQLNENNVSFRVGVDWKPAPGTLLYANVSRGYKAGGFSTFATSIEEQIVPAVQERLTAYEAGFKTEAFDRRLQLNGAVFYYDYKDKQILGNIVDIVFGPEPALVNVPKSRVVGFELSGIAAPVNGLNLSAGVSYAKSKVTQDFYDFTPFPTPQANFKGEPFPASPPWQAYGDIQYEFPVSSSAMAFVGANANYQSGTRQFFYDQTPAGDPYRDLLRVPGRVLVDLRAGVETGPWRVAAYVRNLTDKWYWNSAYYQVDTMVRFTGMPRTYGISVGWKY